jgi:cytochrome d ubiquinol oxidase subunit II
MELIDLTAIWAVIIGFGVIMYVLMDGFDLGVGALYPLAPNERARDEMMNSVAPVWDGNETWLILGGTGLLAAFPLVYSVLLPALYLGVFLLLAGLIFRGIAFEFRFKADRRTKHLWSYSFAGGSMVAAIAQGCVVGAYIQGFETAGFAYAGGPLDWLTPFTVLCGLGLLAGYGLLGATWVIMKTEGETQRWAFRITPKLLVSVLAVFVIISLWTPLVDEQVRNRWTGWIGYLWLLPALTLVCAWLVWRADERRQEGVPFVATMGIFIFTYLGLLASKWPYVVPPEHTLYDAAASPASQLFLLLGFLFIIPIVLGYTAWTYWVFRGKVSAASGYH